MGTYEAICVFNPSTAEDKIETILSKFEKKIKDNEGEVEKVEKWGQKRLAFEFKKHKGIKDGYYVLINLKGTGKTVSALRDAFRIQEEIIRHSIIKAEPKELAALVEATEFSPAFKGENGGQPQ